MNWFNLIKERKLCDTCHKQRISPSASSKGITTCATCVRRSGKSKIKSPLPKGFRRDKK
jgi:hypothetical protein